MSEKRKSKGATGETTKDKVLGWIEYYGSKRFGIGVECTSCNKWRLVYEYVEEHEVPENWECSMSIIDGQTGHCDLPSEYNADYFVEEVYVPGSIVWAKCQSYPWWPAMVEDDPDCEEYHVKGEADGDEEYHVVFFYDKPTRAWVKANHLTCYVKPPSNLQGKKSYQQKLENAKKRADEAVKMPIADRLKKFSFVVLSQKKFPKSRTTTTVPKIPIQPNNIAQPKNTVQPNNIVQSKNTVQPNNTIQLKVPVQQKRKRATTVPKIPAQPKNTVQPNNIVQPKNTVQPNNIVQSNNTIQLKVPVQQKRKRDVKNTANRNLPIKKRKTAGTYGNGARKMSRKPNRKPPRALIPDARDSTHDETVPAALLLSENPPESPAPVTAEDPPVPLTAENPPERAEDPLEPENSSDSCHPMVADAQAAMPNPSAACIRLDVHETDMDTEEIAKKCNGTDFEMPLAFDSNPPSPYPVPDYIKFKRMDELFSDVNSESESENESTKYIESASSSESPEVEWIETNEEYYMDRVMNID